MDDKMVEWLFKNPIGDGGQFTGVSDILTKYGVVPAEVMVETNSSNSTGRMSNLIGLKLKEYGLQLRDLSTTKGTTVADLEKKKTEMLGTIYRMLVLNLGEPPTKFTWTRKDAKGNPVETNGIYASVLLPRIYRGRFEKQLCHVDERSEPRLL